MMRKVARFTQRAILLLLVLEVLIAVFRYWTSDDGETRYLVLWGAIALSLILSAVYAVCFLALLVADVQAERKTNRGAGGL
jgi:hypothetical protein